MALLGGGVGGAGNPLGGSGSFTGPATALEYIGDFVYAYSGLQTATTALKTYLTFTTGANLIVGVLQTNAPVDDDTPTVGATSVTEITLNNSKIAILKTDTKDEDMKGSERMELVLPPYTTVLVTMLDDANEPDRYGSVSFVGRVYRDQ
jgi:hypothetical protein